MFGIMAQEGITNSTSVLSYIPVSSFTPRQDLETFIRD